MNSEITYADGMAEQSNFNQHEAMRLYQCPESWSARLITDLPFAASANRRFPRHRLRWVMRFLMRPVFASGSFR